MRILLLIAALGLANVHLQAQGHWATRVGAWSNDAFNDVAIDAQGDLYVTGEFGGNIELGGGVTLISQGSLDILVAKYSPTGALIWMRTFGGSGLDRGIKLALADDGTMVVTGQFMGSVPIGGTTLVSLGGTQDMFVMKLAQNNGAVQWVRQGGSPDGVDQPNGVSVGPDGSVAVAGEFRGNALFDGTPLTSVTDPDTGLPSVDIFLATYASDGTPMWLKHGAAEFADRGMDVVHDPSGNVYLTGQFTDTLTFDVTHNNAMYSAIFIVRFSPTGQEEWFRAFGGGTYNQVFEMAMVDGNRLVLVGDIQGTVIFLDSQPDLFTATAPRSSFLVEVGLDGEFMAQNTWGSLHAVNTRALSVVDNDIAVLGRFHCQFTDFSAIHGDGTFLATGPFDLYVARFDPVDLSFKEAQQFGGQGDKVPGGIVHAADGAPVFCGSFDRMLIFPSEPGFVATPSGPLLTPTAPASYCGDPRYGHYTGLRGFALKDAFLSRGYVDGRAPFDMFNRSGALCDRTTLDGFIRLGSTGVFGPDSILRCVNAVLTAFTPTAFTPDTSLRHTSANMLYLWNTGDTARVILASTTGWYWVTMSSAAGCWTRTDSMYVTIDPLPPIMFVSDDVVVNSEAGIPLPIEVCDPNFPWIWMTGYDPQDSIWWNGPGVAVPGDSIQAFVTGTYTASALSPHGCARQIQVAVTIDPSSVMPDLDAVLFDTYPQDIDQDDTVRVCVGELVIFSVGANLFESGTAIPDLPFAIRRLYRCGASGPWASMPLGVPFLCSFLPTGSGWYHNTGQMALTNAPCGTDTLFFTISDSVYVDISPVIIPFVTIYGPSLICPGDTATLSMTCINCTMVAWSGPGIVFSSTDSIRFVMPGTYEVTVTYLDVNGCTYSTVAARVVTWNPRPSLHVIPLDGIICPNDSATIFTDTQGTQYQWFGPLGPMTIFNDTIYTSQQGFYYLEMVDLLGCRVTSDPILVTDYATPFLNVIPDNVLCEPGETSTLQVVTTSTATLVWDVPFAGSSALQQIVDTPGLYTCSVNACGITTNLSVQIFGNTAVAALTAPGPFLLCPGDTVVLEAQPGQAFYYWLPGPVFGSSIPVSSAGEWTLVATSSLGCQDSLVVIVEAVPEYEVIEVVDASFCTGEPIIVTVSGDAAITWFADPGLTQVLGTGNSLDLGNITTSTTVYVQQVVGTCSDLLVVPVDILATPAIPLLSVPDTVCLGGLLELSVQPIPNITYEWTGPTGGFTGDSWIIDPATALDGGLYHVHGTNPGCAGPDVEFNITVIPPAAMSIGNDTLICPGGTALFHLPSGFTGPVWSNGVTTIQYTTGSAGEVVLIAQDGNGCSATDTAMVDVFAFSAPISVADVTICLGDDAVLTAIGSGVFGWSLDPLSGSIIHTGPDLTVVQPTDTTIYYVAQTQAGCTSVAIPAVLTVIPIPIDVELLAPPVICLGADFTLSIDGLWAPVGLWSTPSGPYVGSTITIPNATLADAGTYTVIPALGPCIGDTLSTNLDVVFPDVLELGPDTFFCQGGALVIALPPGFTSPVWNTGSTGSFITVIDPDLYIVTAIDSLRCAVTDTIKVDAIHCSGIIPNVFTPNGDGSNDVWLIVPEGFVSAVLTVYNRWGQMVWEGDPIHRGFNGRHMDNGEPLSEGTYFYVLDLVRGNGTVDKVTGSLSLLR